MHRRAAAIGMVTAAIREIHRTAAAALEKTY
jgi:hypothetical protein